MDMKEVGESLFKEAHELWIIPAIEEQQFKEPIFCYLILFREDGVQVLFNTNTRLKIEFEDTKFTPEKTITLDEYVELKIRSISLPDDYKNSGYIAAAWTKASKWFIKFNFSRSKTDALEYLNRAEAFYKAALATQIDSVRAYQCYHAIEQLGLAVVVQLPGMKGELSRGTKHTAIIGKVNMFAGNLPKSLVQALKKLVQSRKAIYGRANPSMEIVEPSLIELPGIIRQLREQLEL